MVLALVNGCTKAPNQLSKNLEILASNYGVRPDWSSPRMKEGLAKTFCSLYQDPSAVDTIKGYQEIIPQPIVLSDEQRKTIQKVNFLNGYGDTDWWQFVSEETGIKPDFTNEKTLSLWRQNLWRRLRTEGLMTPLAWDVYERARTWAGIGLEEGSVPQSTQEMIRTLRYISQMPGEKMEGELKEWKQRLGWNPLDEDRMKEWFPDIDMFLQRGLLEATNNRLDDRQRELFVSDLRRKMDAGMDTMQPDQIKTFIRTGVLPSQAAVKKRILSDCMDQGIIDPPVMKIFREAGLRTTLEPVDLAKVNPDRMTLRKAALFYQRVLPRHFEDRKEAERAFRAIGPLCDLIPDLLAIKGPTRRPEFCPYANELPLLLNYLKEQHGQALEKRGIVEFAKRFGVRNLPQLADVVIQVIRCDDPDHRVATKKLTDAAAASYKIRQAMELLGIKEMEALTPRQFLDRLERFRGQIQADILADRLPSPAVEQTKLGQELFAAIMSFGAKDDCYTSANAFPNTLATVRANTNRLPTLPKFLERQDVPVMEIEEEEEEEEEASDVIKKIEKRMEGVAKEESLHAFLAKWINAADLERNGRECGPVWWVGRWQMRIEQSVRKLAEKERSTANPHGQAAIAKTRMALEEKLARVEDALHTCEDAPAQNKEEILRQTTALLRALQDVARDAKGNVDKDFLIKELGQETYALMYRLMRTYAPTALQATEEARDQENANVTLLRAWSTYFYEEYLEHFSREDEDMADKERQIPHELADLMHHLWRTKGIAHDLRERGMEKSGPPHPLASAIKTYKTLETNRNKVLKGEAIYEPSRIAISPCVGIGRALAGDMANACYSKLRQNLARGEYARVYALLFSLSKKEEKIFGTTLCIDTRNGQGERVLVIRALNPTEAVIHRTLEPVSFVKAIADYYVRAAERSAETDPEDPVKAVHICVSQARAHLTNRDPIAAAVQALLKDETWPAAKAEQEFGELVNEPETNFNGYSIWRSGATKIIWSRNS